MYGAPVALLHLIGKELGKKTTSENLDNYIRYCDRMWKTEKRDNRICIARTLGYLNKIDPERITKYVFTLVESANSWEESDVVAGYGCENLVRKEPEKYVPLILPYLKSDNVWVLRGALVILYRLPMKRPEYTREVLDAIEPLLSHQHEQVKKQNKFGVGILNRGDKDELVKFIQTYKDTENQTIVQVLQEACWKLGDEVRDVVEVWEASENSKIRRTAQSILRRMK
jgi:hypothetical protein